MCCRDPPSTVIKSKYPFLEFQIFPFYCTGPNVSVIYRLGLDLDLQDGTSRYHKDGIFTSRDIVRSIRFSKRGPLDVWSIIPRTYYPYYSLTCIIIHHNLKSSTQIIPSGTKRTVPQLTFRTCSIGTEVKHIETRVEMC